MPKYWEHLISTENYNAISKMSLEYQVNVEILAEQDKHKLSML
jgi:hypothetical protein